MSEMSFCRRNKLKETQNSRKYLSSWVLLKLIKLIKHFCCFEANEKFTRKMSTIGEQFKWIDEFNEKSLTTLICTRYIDIIFDVEVSNM